MTVKYQIHIHGDGGRAEERDVVAMYDEWWRRERAIFALDLLVLPAKKVKSSRVVMTSLLSFPAKSVPRVMSNEPIQPNTHPASPTPSQLPTPR